MRKRRRGRGRGSKTSPKGGKRTFSDAPFSPFIAASKATRRNRKFGSGASAPWGVRIYKQEYEYRFAGRHERTEGTADQETRSFEGATG